jgi:hypothetical protein
VSPILCAQNVSRLKLCFDRNRVFPPAHAARVLGERFRILQAVEEFSKGFAVDFLTQYRNRGSN